MLGKGSFKEEFVTCGGVSLSAVDMRTMESRTVPGLFFAGEVVDVDGVTGGYNFQSAWWVLRAYDRFEEDHFCMYSDIYFSPRPFRGQGVTFFRYIFDCSWVKCL